MVSSIEYVCKIFQKSNISYPLIRKYLGTYQGARNIGISESFAYVLNGLYVNRLVPGVH